MELFLLLTIHEQFVLSLKLISGLKFDTRARVNSNGSSRGCGLSGYINIYSDYTLIHPAHHQSIHTDTYHHAINSSDMSQT